MENKTDTINIIKKCLNCSEEKIMTDFYFCNATKDKHQSFCKECAKIKAKQYNRTPKGRIKFNAYMKKRRLEHPEKFKNYYNKVPEDEKLKVGRKEVDHTEEELKESRKKNNRKYYLKNKLEKINTLQLELIDKGIEQCESLEHLSKQIEKLNEQINKI